MGEKKADPMDVPKVLEALNDALPLQQRSALQYTLAAGSMFGLHVQGLSAQLWEYAKLELEDARQLVEKISALGGDPSVEVAGVAWDPDPEAALSSLIEQEEDCIAALHAVIPHSGQQPESEALEHLMEHLIMRKQGQVDQLKRALRTP
jgi:bacterioferritin (cytochrome b1)